MVEFVVPKSGTYHFATGMEPHLADECTAGCPLAAVSAAAAVEAGNVVTIDFDSTALSVAMNSGTPVKTDDLIVTTATWEEYPRG